MKGVILAAGKGTRLYPVTRVIPKPLLPIANRMTLAYSFDQMKGAGIREIAIVVSENESAMREALGTGSDFGVNLSYIRQPEPKGLAHAVSFAHDFVNGDDFVLYLGDAIYGQSMAPFIQQFKDSGSANLNLVKAVDDPRRFGVANVTDGRIVKLVEKPSEPESNLAMAGLYVFGPQIWSVLPDLKPSARGEFEITDAIQMLIDRGETVIPGIYDGAWFDTGTLPSFLETSRFLTQSKPLIGTEGSCSAELSGHVVIGDKASVSCSAIEDSVILPGAKVEVSGEIRGCLLSGEIRVDGDLVDCVRHGDLTE
ncbi:MAG: NTP transferase domain-containing protein [Fimbriimonadaceae bacterium]|nr:NTP transferase domain-containing protein [Fimbriimonadaceae bacterium]